MKFFFTARHRHGMKIISRTEEFLGKKAASRLLGFSASWHPLIQQPQTTTTGTMSLFVPQADSDEEKPDITASTTRPATSSATPTLKPRRKSRTRSVGKRRQSSSSSTAQRLFDEYPFADEDESVLIEEDDDPVIEEFPIFLNSLRAVDDLLAESSEAADPPDPADSQIPPVGLHVLQYPNRSRTRTFAESKGTGLISMKLKPNSRVLEVEAPIATEQFYDREKGERWKHLQSQVLSGVITPLKEDTPDLPMKNSSRAKHSVIDAQGKLSHHYIGVFSSGELHLVPVDSVAQLRPAFKYIDAEINEMKEGSKQLMRQEDTGPKKQQAIQMSVKSSGDVAPRLSSSLMARKKADEEKSIPLQLYDVESYESAALVKRLLLLDEAEQVTAQIKKSQLESSTSKTEYISMIVGKR